MFFRPAGRGGEHPVNTGATPCAGLFRPYGACIQHVHCLRKFIREPRVTKYLSDYTETHSTFLASYDSGNTSLPNISSTTD